ncbi:ubiquitin-like modifier-activating enzyme ATG7 isoform X1 [Chlorella sorokiniana]|uniref:Ubiquitin-like modifier-activating enzyme ATG7 isoform X1 n=1 Tax=Chlorella sorokiniana TaxID=3076 RepID=A0A2P6TFY3_CHLSO|nr:ubiquitin-like modifier-activating enzyme ATG7 isoform X1 [Chlorella sorokiniana]|eukprot:PRW33020.1 ubiquitin-like modifier-activating enzyme ATG7 isoform X1 [Chlorella sorokiniana]
MDENAGQAAWKCPVPKEGRHRCKGPPPPGPAAAAAAAAAAAESAKIAEAEAAAAEAAATAERSKKRAGKRVRWALPDSDEEDEEQEEEGMTSEDDVEDAPKRRRATVAAAVAAAAAHESPLRVAPAAPALSTPRGAAAAQLLAGLRGGGPLVLPLVQVPLLGKPALAASAPSKAAGAGAAPPLQGASWWQTAVRPELAQQRSTVPAAPPAGGAATVPAGTMGMVVGPPMLPLAAPVLLPLVPALPFASSAADAAVPLPQALPPQLEQALGQPAGLAVAASLGELLVLLKTVVSVQDAEAFVGLVFEDQARTVEAQGGATADDLLQSLAANLAERCAAVRQLIQAKAHAQLADRVASAVKLSRLSKLVTSLNAAAAQHVQQQRQQGMVQTLQRRLPEMGTLQFWPLESKVDVTLWAPLGELKLHFLKLDEGPLPLTTFWAASDRAEQPGLLTVAAASLPAGGSGAAGDAAAAGVPPRSFAAQGELYVLNTVEGLLKVDRKVAVQRVCNRVWAAIESGEAEARPALLQPLVLLTYCDLKHFKYRYWFAFPALQPPAPFTLASSPVSLQAALGDAAAAVADACSSHVAASGGAPAWLVVVSGDGQVATAPLTDWHSLQQQAEGGGGGGGSRVYLAMADSSNEAAYPGWPLRNLLLLVASRWRCRQLPVLCMRERHGRYDAAASLTLQVELPELPPGFVPAPVGGWEPNERGKLGVRTADLGPSMDPKRLAESAVELNLRLMRWRAAPSLDVGAIAAARCLLLGAGTLGCSVARTLLGWGVRRITLVDNSRVAYSNPVRQSLFNFEDCLGGGKPKAVAAAEALQRIFPGVTARGVQLSIPMPGHPIGEGEMGQVQRDIQALEALVDEHDVVFLLMDTRESRWLPTLLCAARPGKLAINAALGFDGFMVMRHGAAVPLEAEAGSRALEAAAQQQLQGLSLEAAEAGGSSGGEQPSTSGSSDEQPSSPAAAPSAAAAPSQPAPQQRLGCYFCNDVVAPVNSTVDRAMDQQCTVARPGLSAIAGALAAELMAAVLQHPLGAAAPAAGSPASRALAAAHELPLGEAPHMVRGQLGGFSQMCLTGQAFRQCTACSPAVVARYRRRGADFVLQGLLDPKSLEDLTGLTELHAASEAALEAWEASDEEEQEGSSGGGAGQQGQAGGGGRGGEDDEWWHLADDVLPLVALAVFIPSVAFCITYAAVLPAVHHRPGCSGSHARLREAVVWGTLAFAVLHMVLSGAIVLAGLRGAPFEASKRRLVAPLVYIHTVLWICWLGYTPFALWATHHIQDNCWTGPLRDLELAALYTSICVYFAIFLTFFFALNALASYDPYQRWRIRLEFFARKLGCAEDINSADQYEGEGQNNGAPLEEIAASFARFFGTIDLEKLDIVVGFVLVEILQVQQRKTAIADRLRQAGIPIEHSGVPGGAAQEQAAGSALDGGSTSGAAGDGAASAAGAATNAEVRVAVEQGFHQWMKEVSEGNRLCVTPSRWGAKLAPQLTPQQSAEIYTGCKDYVALGDLLEAQRWANFAVAAYGASGYLWNTPKMCFCLPPHYWHARLHLKRLVRPRARVTAGALPPVQQKLRESSRYVRHYVAAQQVAGIPPEDFVHVSFANAALGAPPYIIALHRESRTVVLALRGSHSMADAVTDLMDRPVDICDWLPEGFRQEHPELSEARVHLGMLSAAKAVLQDLNKHQILPILLTGQPLDPEEQRRQQGLHTLSEEQQERYSQLTRPTAGRGRDRLPWRGQPGGAAGAEQGSPAVGGSRGGGASGQQGKQGQQHAQHAQHEQDEELEERLSPADFQRLLRQRGLDCRGWKLVVAAHSLGAAVAALVGMHFRLFAPDTKVWSFNPPGGMVSANLSHALQDFVTSVVVGKDGISRLGTVTFENLLDQMVLALARSRLPKLSVLLRLRSKHLRRRPPGELFRPLDDIPAEALAIVRQYYESKCTFDRLRVPMFPPGRVMLLRRLKPARHSSSGSGGGGGGSGPSSNAGSVELAPPPAPALEQHQNGRQDGGGPTVATSGQQWQPDGAEPGERQGRAEQRQSGVHWDAVWVQAEALMSEGILLSSHQASDHYTARLTQVLEDLTGRPTTQQQAQEEHHAREGQS